MVSHAYLQANSIRDDLTRVCEDIVSRNPQLPGLAWIDGAVASNGYSEAWDTYCGETEAERSSMAVAHNFGVFEDAKRAIDVESELLDTFAVTIHFDLDGAVRVKVRVPDVLKTESRMRPRKRPKRSAARKAGPRIAKMAKTLARLDSEGRLQ
jgi:hypothetical protein